MHLHDRHGAHLTLQTPLKQARQSLAQRRGGAGFGSFSLQPPWRVGFIRLFRLFRKHFFTPRNAEFPFQKFLSDVCKLTVASLLMKLAA
jgi:hypothetical protein